jgi:lactate dehydrogenase-like 2-hydroxyacid dehydrogenase
LTIATITHLPPTPLDLIMAVTSGIVSDPPPQLNNTPRRLRVLHIGDPIKYNPSTYDELSALFEVIRPSTKERQRPEFIRALKERRWGDFDAIMRPFWITGGEMGQWDEELIALLPPSVKVFASAGAGFDWADVRLLAGRGIVYCNSSPACAESVADFATAMVISTFRQLPWCTVAGASESPADWRACHEGANADSHTMSGRVLGIVGLGNIGQRIARRCGAGFGMKIHYHDVARKPNKVEQKAVLGMAEVVFHDTLESLVRASDCVVLCAPAANGAAAQRQAQSDGPPSPEVTMMAAEQFSWFRPGARFVNVARGSMVDEEALANALEEGRIAAATLDVHAHEPRVNERLRQMAAGLPSTPGPGGKARGHVMLSCHNGGGTHETHVGFEELSMRNVMAVLSGEVALTPVNLEFMGQER